MSSPAATNAFTQSSRVPPPGVATAFSSALSRVSSGRLSSAADASSA